jgi:hypothetical protein
MERLGAQLAGHYVWIVPVLAVGLLICLTMIISLYRRTTAMSKLFERLTRGVQIGNIEEILIHHLDEVRSFADRIGTLESRADGLDRRVEGCIQHVGMVRFDAFDDVGGRQSFACAILDAQKSGIVISSIYGRSDLRVYLKHLEKGSPSLPLTAEETRAVAQAVGTAET